MLASGLSVVKLLPVRENRLVEAVVGEGAATASGGCSAAGGAAALALQTYADDSPEVQEVLTRAQGAAMYDAHFHWHTGTDLDAPDRGYGGTTPSELKGRSLEEIAQQAPTPFMR